MKVTVNIILGLQVLCHCDIKGPIQKYQIQYQCYKKKDYFYQVWLFIKAMGKLVLVLCCCHSCYSCSFVKHESYLCHSTDTSERHLKLWIHYCKQNKFDRRQNEYINF